MSNQNRVPPGVRTGGQYAPGARSASTVQLGTLDPGADPAPECGAGPDGREDAGSVVDPGGILARRFDTVDDKLRAIHAELADAVADLRGDAEWNRMLDVAGRFHQYSLNNQMLIILQTGGRATRVAGFRKWQEMGRQVRKGEKGIAVLAPKKVRRTDTDADGRPVVGADGKPVRRTVVVGFTTATVFDVRQTEGEDLPDMEASMTLSQEPPPGFREDLESAISDAGFIVEHGPIHGGASGYTDPARRRVVIRDDLSPANTVSTLAHELGHIKAGHLDRIDEYHMGHNGSRDAMEIEAESVGYALCRANGLDPVGKSGRYVAGWGGTDPERVRQAAETVTRTVKDILSSGRWRNAATALTGTSGTAGTGVAA